MPCPELSESQNEIRQYETQAAIELFEFSLVVSFTLFLLFTGTQLLLGQRISMARSASSLD